jgi:catechol 2,3-dioxygenase-like lactoylglutathione lyase family enzyme
MGKTPSGIVALRRLAWYSRALNRTYSDHAHHRMISCINFFIFVDIHVASWITVKAINRKESDRMEAYPMPMFVKMEVRDIERSVKWYKDVLEFNEVYCHRGAENQIVMVHIRGERYQDLMLIPAGSPVLPEGFTINLQWKDVDLTAKRAPESNIMEGPADRPWNARELVLIDPDGYKLTLSELLHRGMSFDEVRKGF